MEAKSEPAGSQSNDVPQIQRLLLQQKEELFQRLDTWLSKAEEALLRNPQAAQVPDLGHLFASAPCPARSGGNSPGAPVPTPGSAMSEVLPQLSQNARQYSSEDTNSVLDHSLSKRTLPRRTMTGLEEYEEAKEEGHRVEGLKKLMSESKVIRTDTMAACKKRAAAIASNPFFNFAVALVIISNSVFLGIQLELGTQNSGNAMAFLVGHLIYAILFTLEMAIRFIAAGCRNYLIGPEWYWNWLDLLVVIPAWVELITDFMEHGENVSSGASNFRILRVLRITRMLHVIRSVRLIRVIHAFRELILSILDTTRQLGWAMILLLLIIYSFSILFTDAVSNEQLTDPQRLDLSNAQQYFGGVFIACETLFRACLSGFDWVDAADALKPVGEVWVQLFHIYVAFCSFAVLNVITGVFVNSAIKTREKDHETLVLHVQKFKDLVGKIWNKLDTSGDGQLTITEFEQMFKDPDMQAFFEAIEVNAVDAWTLFDSLDADGDHLVSYEEFCQRCTQLHGSARAVDLFALTQQNGKVWDEVLSLKTQQQESTECLKFISQILMQHMGDPMLCVQVS